MTILLMFAGPAYAISDPGVGLVILNDLDGNGNITVINGSKVKVEYEVLVDTGKVLHKKDKIQLLRVSDDKVISSVERGKGKSGTVKLLVKNSEDEQLYVRYVRKGKATEVISTASHPDDNPGDIRLTSIAKLSLSDLTIRMNAIPKANIVFHAPTSDDDVNAGYQEGITWVNVATQQAYILVDSTAGSAIWKKITPIYEVGQRGPAGGIVFYVTDGGVHGLEAAPVDQAIPFNPGTPWGCFGTNITGADGTAIGTGTQNTADILADCVETGIAAELADAYTLNGFDDWFLPSRDELYELYLQKDFVGGLSSHDYWSSSEYDANNAWEQVFTSDFQFATTKASVAVGVRAIRAF